jgi:hypothetical protein
MFPCSGQSLPFYTELDLLVVGVGVGMGRAPASMTTLYKARRDAS